MTDKCIIKIVTQQETPILLELIKELATYESRPMDVTATLGQLTDGLCTEPKYAHAVIAYAHEQPIGFCIYYFTFSSYKASKALYIEDIYLKASARGQGYGRALMSFLAGVALSKQCAAIELSVLKNNQAGISFYEHLGAKPVDKAHSYRFGPQEILQLIIV